ncbi:MAG TPA: hypothetical protein RMH99_31040 [Sandaracinaceae bacterium LLY-WYZ-13_1]|nr:hypothetical protein [Sandaracinaceae bacterium LLY-WYZ-13_1]
MDVQLITASAFDLPSSQRVDAIVHDGATDLRTWPGPGPDRDLAEHYGPELQNVLTRERERLDGGALPIGGMLRLHRGKLHCDFLLWVATRPPENKGIQAPAPREETLSRAVKDALAFVAERHVARVAFGPLGAGPDALDEVRRLVLVAKAANAYYDEAFQSGRPAGVEEVLVCHPYSSKVAEARRHLGRAVKVVQPPARPASTATTTRRRSSGGRSKRSAKPRAPARPKVRLTEEEIGRAKATAEVYDRSREYEPGDYFVHPKFGVGRVEELTPQGFIMVLFEGGETRRLLHRRP